MDFMSAANSCLVGYHSMVVHRNELSDNPTAMMLYQPGNLWVDPDVHQAARLMRWLFENPDGADAHRCARVADIRARYSLAAAGRAMRRTSRGSVEPSRADATCSSTAKVLVS